MKFKVKGLVFVGFAAAILSANAALAANEAQTVTSKAFTEHTYQHKSTAASIGNSSGTWTPLASTVTDDETTAPTSAAVVDYVTSQISTAGGSYQAASAEGDEYAVANGEGGWVALNSDISDTAAADQDFAGANGATSAAIRSFVDAEIAAQHTTDNTTYQAYSNAANQISNGSGGWKALGTTLDTDDDNYDANNAVTAGTIAAAIAASETATTYTSDGTTITQSGNQFLANTTGGVGTGNNNLVTGGQVQTALDGKQSLDNGTKYMVSKEGAWQTVDNAVAVTGPVTRTVDSTTGALTIGVNTTGGVANDGNNLVTGDQVYDYVQTQTGGVIIPAQNSSVCTASTPCALVDVAGSLHWFTMAQTDHLGGVCGDATGNCGAQ